MADLSEVPGLEGLFGLARRDGVDIRATLLRVLTDLYVQIPTHPIDEERQYTEQTLRLLGSADVPTRAALAKRLADYPQTPRAVIERLAHDVIEVAEPMLRHSPCLTPTDLEAIAHECGAAHAAMIARRGETTVSEEQAASAAVELCELFYAAGGHERRQILINLDYASAPAHELPAPLQRADIWRLENAALAHNTVQVVRELERALGVSNAQARRIVKDEQGDPIVVAAKAMNLPSDVLQRVLLFINPTVGQSVDRVYELATLYSEISVAAALRLVAILRDADPAQHKAAPPMQPSRQHGSDAVRRGLFEIAKPQAPRRSALHLQRSGRATRGE
jgi:hypothetical protein